MINASHVGLGSQNIAADNKTLHHVDLSSFDFVVFILFVPQPILIEPVVNLCLGVNGISKVGWSGGCHPEFRFFCDEQVINQLFILPFVVFLNDTEVSASLAYTYNDYGDQWNLLRSVALCERDCLRKN